jgi:hypothetical protein
MLGWEFPPHISGGLGTACFGMTQALAGKGAEICFVMPSVGRGGKNDFLRLQSASGVEITDEVEERMAWAGQHAWDSNIRFMPVTSPLMPYMTPEAYQEALSHITGRHLPGGEHVQRKQGGAYTWDLKPDERGLPLLPACRRPGPQGKFRRHPRP